MVRLSDRIPSSVGNAIVDFSGVHPRWCSSVLHRRNTFLCVNRGDRPTTQGFEYFGIASCSAHRDPEVRCIRLAVDP